MKKIFIFLVVTSALLTGCDQKKLMNGAWKVVSFENISGDKVKLKLNGNMTGNELKIWSSNHFIYVGRYKMDTTNFDNYGSGSYTLEGNHYVENKIITGNTKTQIAPIRILLETKNDTLIQTWPADDKWMIDPHNYFIQKLVRAD